MSMPIIDVYSFEYLVPGRQFTVLFHGEWDGVPTLAELDDPDSACLALILTNTGTCVLARLGDDVFDEFEPTTEPGVYRLGSKPDTYCTFADFGTMN